MSGEGDLSTCGPGLAATGSIERSPMKNEEDFTRRERVAGLVLELQRAASDSSVAVSDLLRKALLAARKLKIIDQEPWIQSELNGYLIINGNYDALPKYRFVKSKIECELCSSSGTEFLDPLLSGRSPSHPNESAADYPCPVPIAEIERTIKGKTPDNYVHLSCPPGVEEVFIETMKLPPSLVQTVQVSRLHGILDAVRKRIEDWTSELEEKGVIVEDPPAHTREGEPVKDMLDISEAADYAGVCTKTIRNWLTQVDGNKPMIAGVTGKGRLTRIPKKSLTPYIKKVASKNPVKRN